MGDGIDDEIRRARERARKETELHTVLAARTRARNIDRLGPIVRMLEKIKKNSYYTRSEEGSLRPFDYEYQLGAWQCGLHCLIRIHDGSDVFCRVSFRLSGSGSDVIDVEVGAENAVYEKFECTNPDECIERFLDLNEKYHFFVEK